MSIEIKISKKRIPYKMAMLYLNKRVEEVKNGKNRELLWILEHPTTYTAGVSFNKNEIIDIPIEWINPNPLQPRKIFEKDLLEELAKSGKIDPGAARSEH